MKAGQFPYSTCAGEDYGKILSIGEDANGTPVMDIEVFDAQDLISCDDDENGDGFGSHPLTMLELPKGVNPILRKVQYKMLDTWEDGTECVECNTPGNGCYRCTKAFCLRDKHEQPFSRGNPLSQFLTS